MKTSILALLGLAALSVGLVLNFVMPRIRYYAWIILFYFSRVQNTLISHQGKFGVGTTVGISLFFWCHSPRQRYQRGEFPPFRLHWLSPIHTGKHYGKDNAFYFMVGSLYF
tara:strand:+ start:88 stop:420 length:333 start_codon:yes stop_codon:yes gene_type:complete